MRSALRRPVGTSAPPFRGALRSRYRLVRRRRSGRLALGSREPACPRNERVLKWKVTPPEFILGRVVGSLPLPDFPGRTWERSSGRSRSSACRGHSGRPCIALVPFLPSTAAEPSGVPGPGPACCRRRSAPPLFFTACGGPADRLGQGCGMADSVCVCGSDRARFLLGPKSSFSSSSSSILRDFSDMVRPCKLSSESRGNQSSGVGGRTRRRTILVAEPVGSSFLV